MIVVCIRFAICLQTPPYSPPPENCSAFLRHLVDKLVEIAEAHLAELLAAALAVVVGVVTGNQGQADGDFLL